MKLRNILMSFAFMTLFCYAQENTEFKKVIPFEENGSWGLMINGEVCFLPSFDDIRPDGNYFIYKTDGKEGIMSSHSILCPPIYDKILNVNSTHNIVVYQTEDGRGVEQFEVPKFVNLSNKIVDGSKFAMNINPGEYKDFILSPEAKTGSSLYYAVCETHDGRFKIIDVYGNDMTPYYDLKKLKGNIKSVLDRKIPLSELKVNTDISDVEKEFKKIYNKHPEFYCYNHAYLRKIIDSRNLTDENAVATITSGPFTGYITEDGFVSIPLEYTSAEEVLQRDPTNLYALNNLIYDDFYSHIPKLPDTMFMDSNQSFEAFRQYYAEKYSVYSSYLPIWNNLLELAHNKNDQNFIELFSKRITYCKEQAEEADKELRKYNKVATVTATLNSFASGLMNAATIFNNNNISSESAASSYSVTSASTKSTSSLNKTSISEQTSYNRDKKTYERYDSQLASHFAGNQTMNSSSVKNAQSNMRSLRLKWENKGKSFPHSSNEDR